MAVVTVSLKSRLRDQVEVDRPPSIRFIKACLLEALAVFVLRGF
jgi:hypothetical protein